MAKKTCKCEDVEEIVMQKTPEVKAVKKTRKQRKAEKKEQKRNEERIKEERAYLAGVVAQALGMGDVDCVVGCDAEVVATHPVLAKKLQIGLEAAGVNKVKI